jgi:hypothetical protein
VTLPRLASTVPALFLLAACAQGPSYVLPTDPPVDVQGTGKPGQATATRTRTERLVVTAVDPVKRTISLKQPTGEIETRGVGPQVEEFEKVKAGDVLLAQFDETLVLELQPANTRPVPETAVPAARTADPEALPGVGGATGSVETVTVVSIDTVGRVVVFLRQNGETFWVKAAKGLHIEQLKLGQPVFTTLTRSMIVKLQHP